MYFPSIKSNIRDRVCNHCGIYCPSIAAVKRHKGGDGCESGEMFHKKVVEQIELEEVQDNEEAEEDEIIVEEDASFTSSNYSITPPL